MFYVYSVRIFLSSCADSWKNNKYIGKWVRAHSRKISFNVTSAPENYRKRNNNEKNPVH